MSVTMGSGPASVEASGPGAAPASGPAGERASGPAWESMTPEQCGRRPRVLQRGLFDVGPSGELDESGTLFG